jgi:multidrug efflux pump subunit AcrA (membrane-fusion protein)
MTEPKTRSEQLKIALIPVLGVVLMVVLLGGDPEESAGEPYVDPYAARRLAAQQNESEQAAASVASERAAINWPNRSVQTILAHDPFILHAAKELALQETIASLDAERVAEAESAAEQAAAAEAAAAAQLEEEHRKELLQQAIEAEQNRLRAIVQSLQSLRVSMVFRGPHRTSALLGDKLITEGDLLEDAIRVVSIDDSGIVLQIESSLTPQTTQH